mmetsp:Transcript_30217/g.68100  ORF Transcript_30217/g.68100 Transcript_30217/m.68100 type:complete len:504 (-) Transcript_30217:8-1519(-)
MAGDGELTMVHLVTFVAGAALALLLAFVGHAIASRRFRDRNRVCQLVSSQEKGATVGDDWSDPEKGQSYRGVSSPDSGGGPAVPLPLTAQQLFESVRDLLGNEISKGLARSELVERLDRLEKQAEAAGDRSTALNVRRTALAEPVGLHGAAVGLRGAALASDDADAKNALKVSLRSTTKSTETRTPNSSDRSGGSSFLPEEDAKDLSEIIAPAGPVAPAAPPSLPKEVPVPPPMLPPSAVESRTHLEYGPTARQRRQHEPPEKISHGFDEETALQASLTTVQRVLGKRDAQTTELHRQLREARQGLWLHTEEARVANARLHALLADPSRAPQAQAEALKRLHKEVKDLSCCLADSRAEEQQWATIAKRQKAFFMQNERLAKEPKEILRNHPAGEIFLAPPPVVLDGEEQPSLQPTWDIGTSHCNPYCVDSWPFEPNVLAQRASQEPNLSRWEEGEDECDDDDDEEDQMDFRQRWIAGEGDEELEDDDEESQEPPRGSETARRF